MNPEGKRELALPPGSYAYIQDESKGPIRVHVGASVINQTAQDRPCVYDHQTRQFKPVELHQSVRQFTLAGEGDYIVLENPAATGAFPKEGTTENAPELLMGRKLNIPGPVSFALYPGQWATQVAGHNLRSNEFLIVRIYNEEEAAKNWSKAVLKTKTGDSESTEEETEAVTKSADELNLTMGKLLIIKGTDVSFYIPPTGVEVLKDPNTGQYVRQAVTLERLEYCILIDEDGNKRYERGPQVVFPEPTEEFFTKGGKRKFTAIELNEIQGIHIKVIAPYNDDGSAVDDPEKADHKEGDELFIKGDECAIYFPRPEHSIIRYGEGDQKQDKHYATAIPVGEGRYVMNRRDGTIKTVVGPKMLLPDPRYEVIVRRILSDKEVDLWYPGNTEALQYNRQLRAASASETAQFVSDDELRAKHAIRTRGATRGLGVQTIGAVAADMADFEGYEEAGSGMVGEEFERRSRHTKPRTLTLDTKFEGVPKIQVWTGYAVMLVKANGDRRVEIGPKRILLDYDETLEVLELSTGKPKNTDNLKKTVYLRTKNNKVSDIVMVETKDHAPISVKMSYKVNFENEPTLWFDSDNYVKLLCDHVRSMLKGSVRKTEVETFYGDGEAIVRDIILGKKVPPSGAPEGLKAKATRPFLIFEENGMKVADVEILGIKIEDDRIAQLLSGAQRRTVEQNIELNRAEKDLKVRKRKEEIDQEIAEAEQKTVSLKNKLQILGIEETQQVQAAAATSNQQREEQAKLLADLQQAVQQVAFDADLARRKDNAAQVQAEEEAKLATDKARLEAETKAVVDKFAAAQPAFAECILALSNAETLTKIAQAHSVETLIGGESVVDALKKIFGDGVLQDGLGNITNRMRGGKPAMASPRD